MEAEHLSIIISSPLNRSNKSFALNHVWNWFSLPFQCVLLSRRIFGQVKLVLPLFFVNHFTTKNVSISEIGSPWTFHVFFHRQQHDQKSCLCVMVFQFDMFTLRVFQFDIFILRVFQFDMFFGTHVKLVLPQNSLCSFISENMRFGHMKKILRGLYEIRSSP